MNVVVNVAGAKAAQAQLAALQKQTAGLNGATAAAAATNARAAGGLHAMTRGMERYGKNMQWVGRQIEYNFTLPLAVAGGFAVKFAMDNERAFIRLQKVYEDMGHYSGQVQAETEALGRAFRYLSDQFGVAQAEVIDAGATFAQAGAGNIAVARGVHAALELQILGNMDLADATKALISVQAQYNVSSKELTQIIADLNAVENTTTVTLEDQITAMQKSAGVAREAGVSHRELSGFIAAMVPAAGNANEAGNSLKTTITRIMAPTRQAREAIEDLGISTTDLAWRNANATERFVLLADALENVSTEQRTVALTHIAGRRQVSRLAIMLRDLTNEQGRYATALRVTEDPADSMLRKQKEIDIYLRSGPQGFKIMVEQIKNYAAEIGAQIMPTLIGVMVQVRNMVRAFAELDPQVRQTILSMLLLIMVVGPIVRILGSTVLLVTQFIKLLGFLWIAGGKVVHALGGVLWVLTNLGFIFGKVTSAIVMFITSGLAWFDKLVLFVKAAWAPIAAFFAKMIGALSGFLGPVFVALKLAFVKAVSAATAALIGLIGPIGLIVAAVLALIALGWFFRDQLGAAFTSAAQWIANAWGGIVRTVANVMRRVVEVVRDAARAVIDLFSQMLNPFGRRSPTPPPVSAPPLEKRAAGGPVKKGELYLVGEHGPELWTAHADGQIIPAGLTSAMRSMSAGQSTMGNFQRRVQPARDQMRRTELSEMRSDVTSWVPSAGPEFDAMVRQINALDKELLRLEGRIKSQERVVEDWRRKLDAANNNVQRHEDRLASLRKAAQALSDQLNQAQSSLDQYANMPIKGMRRFEDALWDNEMAQKRLRLALLDLEDAEGPVDDLRDKFAKLQGEIEMMTGKREDLRLSGAGSDVLGFYDQQIDAARAAQRELTQGGGGGPASEADKLRKELEDLQKQAERMQLERDLEFDPLTRQISRMVDGYKELPFDQIVAGVKTQQREVARLTSEYNKANGAVERQEKILERAIAQRDAIKQRYDREYESLQILNTAYSDMQSLISEMNSELEGFARAAAAAAQAAADAARAAAEARAGAGGSGLGSGAAGGALGGVGKGLGGAAGKLGGKLGSDVGKAAGSAAAAATGAGIDDMMEEWGDYDIPGGEAGLQWEEGSIDDLMAEWENQFGDMFGDFDLFAPIREKWQAFKDWWSNAWEAVKEAPGRAWNWIAETASTVWASVSSTVSEAWATVSEAVSAGWEGFTTWLANLWEPIGETLSAGWESVKTLFTDAWERIKENMAQGWEDFKGLFEGPMDFLRDLWDRFWNSEIGQELTLTLEFWKEKITNAWESIKEYFSTVWENIKTNAIAAWNSITEFFTTAWENIKTNVAIVWEQVRTYFSNLWENIRTSITTAWENIRTFFSTTWESIRTTIVERWNVIKDYLSGVFEPVARVFREAWNNLRTFFRETWNNIKDLGTAIWNNLKAFFTGWVNDIKLVFGAAWAFIREAAGVAWELIKGVIVGVLRVLRGDVQGAVDRVREAVAAAWERVRTITSEVWERVRSAISDKIEAIKSVVRSGRDAIGRIWDNIKSKIRAPIAAAVNVAINPIIRGINRVAGMVGLGSINTITIPQFHKGGVVGEAGDPRNLGKKPLASDEQLAVLRNGERVLTKAERQYYEGDPQALLPEVGGPWDWVKSVGSAIANKARDIFDDIKSIRNAAMGAIGNITGGNTDFGKIIVGLGRRAGRAALDFITGADERMVKAPALGTGIGYRAMYNAVKEQFPWARLTSGLRLGAITATGNPSYHGMGRAVDLAGRGFMNHSDMLAMNKWIYSNYKSKTKELIYSGRGSQQVHNGRDHYYSGITRRNHFDHVHWAMDNGGFLQPGWNPPIFNGLGREEIVSPERLMRRIVREEVVRVGPGDTNMTNNFYGDLSFPSVTSEEDAEGFIRNLESMVG
jgi:TP901 family phage tail tape measure protein